jgi:hypothetical protein
MYLDCLDPVKVHSLMLQPRKDASASTEQYINANLIRINVTNWHSPNGNASYLIILTLYRLLLIQKIK